MLARRHRATLAAAVACAAPHRPSRSSACPPTARTARRRRRWTPCRRALLDASRYRCGNDMICSWAGSLACADGISVIAGTGSMAYGEYAGRAARAGGWGELIGDEGSAYWIAREGMNLFSRMSDGRAPRGPLYRWCASGSGSTTISTSVPRIYGEARGRARRSRTSRSSFTRPRGGRRAGARDLRRAARRSSPPACSPSGARSVAGRRRVSRSRTPAAHSRVPALVGAFRDALAGGAAAFEYCAAAVSARHRRRALCGTTRWQAARRRRPRESPAAMRRRRSSDERARPARPSLALALRRCSCPRPPGPADAERTSTRSRRSTRTCTCTARSRRSRSARESDGFRVLTINVNYRDFPPLAEQLRSAVALRRLSVRSRVRGDLRRRRHRSAGLGGAYVRSRSTTRSPRAPSR